ncbi:(Fe-S)-binding protein [Magnetovibrio sp.]|uniref:(Fe-S)-binding protein n=1 Tax=Magnetovibrio sp. TaxID=2024836 RepID=UPI0039C97643
MFVTCLVDLMRPSVGFAALRLLARAGAEVVVPDGQTCCGQPAYNSGDMKNARKLAQNVIEAFADFDHVVAPSGSCAGQIVHHYPKLFADDPDWRSKAEDLATRTFELTAYLVEHLDLNDSGAVFHGSATYHDSCAGLRELGIKKQPRHLLATVDGLILNELEESEACCGFGGLFSIKYPDVSGAIVDKKADRVEKAEADLLLGGDLGCLMNMSGKLRRRGSGVRVFHVAEVLANMTDGPAIGEDVDA